ncbi:solute carrier family 22 member 4-like [Toxotes jaculatrix]|uniref:solute carrier family 22 member 4-like n=1 Tax=Toxotes jaculatrix TaxID=941984 RepID=UPI001B3AE44D|nr:solute carrier family 22 member 4-like [Toxotes jaculatrix]
MLGGKPKDFDEITSFLGDYGFFQILMIVLLSLSAVPCGYMGVIVVFISDTPEHRCKVSINTTRSGTDVELPFHERSSWIGPDSCSRYKLSGNGTVTGGFSNDTEQCLDGWVYSTERYTSTIVSEWDLVCDNAWKVPFSTSSFFVGVLIGSFVSGHLSDRFGRKPVFFFTMVLQTVTALIQATSVSWVMFCILSCLRGLGQISSYIVSLVLGCEMLSQSARVSFTLLGHSLGFGIGYALLPLFAYFIRGWRMLLVATAIPCLLFIPTWWLIPESPRWLLQKGRVEEAELVIRNAAKRNRVPVPEVIFGAGDCLELMQNKGEVHLYTYVDLIRTRNMRNITILGVFIWMSVAMVFYGLALNTSNLNGNIYLNCFISGATDIVMYVAFWLLVNRAPRPTLLFSTLMFCGITLLIIRLVPEDMHLMFQVLAFVGKMGVSGAYCFIYVFFTELIPTVVRNMGLGVASTAARIGTIICPYVIYTGVYNKILPYVIFGTVSIVAAVVSMLLPDTRNNKLPDLISQAKPIRGCCPQDTGTVQADATEGSKEMSKSAPC